MRRACLVKFQLQPQYPENAGKPRKSKLIGASFFKRVECRAADVGLVRQILLAQVKGFPSHSDLGTDGG